MLEFIISCSQILCSNPEKSSIEKEPYVWVIKNDRYNLLQYLRSNATIFKLNKQNLKFYGFSYEMKHLMVAVS